MIIYIIGAGVMGKAIAERLAQKHTVYIFDHNPRKAKIPGTVFIKNLKNISRADFVFIAVKPQDIAGLAGSVSLADKTVLVSIAAGVALDKLGRLFSHKKLIRLMPNLGLAVGQGIAGWKASGLTPGEKSASVKLLDQVCENFEVGKESDINSITAVSGSGPAYFFYLADALYNSAKNLGLDPKMARRLVEKTFAASANLQAGEDYQKLTARVRSKKGTTDAALKVFDKLKMRTIITKAVAAAKKRAQELSHA